MNCMSPIFNYCVSEGIFPRTEEEDFEQKKYFVNNLGILLSQTREGIEGCWLDDYEFVHVVFKNGYIKLVNVSADSYMAIIRDVTKSVEL